MLNEHRFAIGQRVRVLAENPTGNPRTPGYIRGRTGVITDLHGVIVNPRDHRRVYPPLCTVLFTVAGEAESADLLAVDIHEEWLEPVGS